MISRAHHAMVSYHIIDVHWSNIMIQVHARHIINDLHGCLWTDVAHSAQYTMLHWVVIVAHGMMYIRRREVTRQMHRHLRGSERFLLTLNVNNT